MKHKIIHYLHKNRTLQSEIHKRKQAEAALREYQDKYHLIFANDLVATYILDTKTFQFLEVNDAFVRLYGYSREEVFAGLTVVQISAEEEQTMQSIQNMLVDGPVHLPLRWHRKKSGELFPIELFAAKTRWKDVDVNVVSVLDISQRKQDEDANLKYQEQFRSLFNNMAEGVALHRVIYDAQGNAVDYEVLEVNHSFEIILNVAKDQVVHQLSKVAYGTAEPPYLAEYARVAETGTPLHFETYFPPLDKHLDISVAPLGKGMFATIFSDISTRKQVEESLRQSEERFSLVFRAIPVATAISSMEEGHIIAVNAAWERLFGYTSQEAIGNPAGDLGIWQNFEERGKMVEGLKLNGFVRMMELTGQMKTGEARNVLLSAELIQLEGSTCILTLMEDVTERQRSEEALRQSAENFRQLADNVREVFWIRDIKTRRMEYISPAYEKVWGLTCESMYENPEAFSLSVHPDDAERVAAAMRRQQASEWFDEEYRIVRPDGSMRWVWARTYPVYDEKGQAFRIAGIAEDITAKKELDEETALDQYRVSQLFKISQHKTASSMELVDFASNEAIALSGSQYGYIYYYNEEKQQFDLHAWSENVLRDCKILDTPKAFLLENSGLWGEAVRQRKAIVDNNFVATHASRKGIPPGHLELTRFLTMPVFSDGRIVAVVGVANKAQNYTDRDVRQLSLMMDSVWKIIERKRAEEALDQQFERMRALNTIDRAIIANLDLGLTLNVLVTQALEQLNVDAVSILRLNPYSRNLSFAVGRGFHNPNAALKQTSLRMGQGLAGTAALDRKMVQIPNLGEAGVEFVNRPFLVHENFVTYYGVPLIAKGRVTGVIEIFNRKVLDPDADWIGLLEIMADQAAIAIDNAELFETLQRSKIELELAYDVTLEGWSHALDLRDKESEGHTQRVADMTVMMSRALGMAEEELIQVRRGAVLHDIGKMAIPDSVLHKPGPLSEEEWEIMRKHPVYAYEFLYPIQYLRPALDIPYCHHEKWDGTGYPNGLKNMQIPLMARIFSVVDVWDALTTDRVYNPRWPKERAVEYIRGQAGKQFDPEVVAKFLEICDSF